MKKFLSALVSLIIILSTIPSNAFASDEIKVFVDGKYIKFDVAPRDINGRTMVPVRAIFEAVGAKVEWNDRMNSVSANNGNAFVSMSLNSNVFTVNLIPQKMDVTPVAIDGRVLAPARYVGESFGYIVTWDEALNSVFITNPNAKDVYYPASALPDFGAISGIACAYSEVTPEDDGTFTHAYKYNVTIDQISNEHILDSYLHYIRTSGWKSDGVKYEDAQSNVAYYTFVKLDSKAMVAVHSNEATGAFSVWVLYTSYTKV